VSQLRAVSLFSNCGAGDIGYREAGFRFDVMAELDPRRLEVCLLNHPGAIGVPGDIRKTWRKVIKRYRDRAGDARPALLCACPPCQGMSSARSGKGSHDDADAGSRDDRNLLVTVIAKVAKELQPKIIVVENVHAFLSRKVRHPVDKRPISAANILISSLARDYAMFPLVADLSSFGIPQSRTRAFLTFIRRDVTGLARLRRMARSPYPRPSHGSAGGERKPVTIEQALQQFGLSTLDAKTRATAYGEDNQLHFVPVWDDRTYAMVSGIPAGTGRSAWENNLCMVCGKVEVESHDARCPKCGEALLRPVVFGDRGAVRLVKGFKSSYRRMFSDRPAATITTASGHVGSDFTIHPTENRVLSALECALLQTFPINFKWGDSLQKWGHTNIRSMIGEAVPPAFTRQHGEMLVGIIRNRWSCAPISSSDDRVVRPWKLLSRAAKKDGRTDPQTFAHDF
jgi:DNA (cytosine-5)-methyltransferase 1